VRLQQILSIFFPAYAVKGKRGQEVLMQSILPLLHLVHAKQSQKKKPKGTKAMPIVKMTEYLCSMVEVGKDAAEDALEKAKTNDKETESDIQKVESSSSILAAIQIATFLSTESENLGTTFLRVLCKLLGGIDLDVEYEESKDLSTLKHLMDDLSMEITDATSQRALSQLDELLADVVIEEEVNESSDDQTSLAEAFDNTKITSEDATTEGDESVMAVEDGRLSTGSSIAGGKENATNDEFAASVEKGRPSTDSSIGTRLSLSSRGGN
jgi:hypothetical protein